MSKSVMTPLSSTKLVSFRIGKSSAKQTKSVKNTERRLTRLTNCLVCYVNKHLKQSESVIYFNKLNWSDIGLTTNPKGKTMYNVLLTLCMMMGPFILGIGSFILYKDYQERKELAKLLRGRPQLLEYLVRTGCVKKKGGKRV